MPAVGDLPACPFLTISMPDNGQVTIDEVTYCGDGEDVGSSGWLTIPWGEDSIYGCGLIYDCCAKVIPIACMGSRCFFFIADASMCGLGGGSASGNKFAKAALLVNEYLGLEDLDDNGMVYGRDFHIQPDGYREKVVAGYDDGTPIFKYRDPETGAIYDDPLGDTVGKPPALKGLPLCGSSMSWDSYLSSVE